MTLSITLTHEEKSVILQEVRESFVSNNMAKLDRQKYSFKLVKYITSEYMAFYEEFFAAIFEVLEYLHKDCQVCTRESIKECLKNKRYHNLEDWEVEQIFLWLDGNDVYYSLKVGFFDNNFGVEDIEEMIEYVISEANI
jgi:hypothetical protein